MGKVSTIEKIVTAVIIIKKLDYRLPGETVTAFPSFITDVVEVNSTELFYRDNMLDLLVLVTRLLKEPLKYHASTLMDETKSRRIKNGERMGRYKFRYIINNEKE